MAEATLIFAGSDRSPDLFAAVGAVVIDPFLFVDFGDKRAALIGSLDWDGLRAVDPAIELRDPRTFGTREMIEGGMTREQAELEAIRLYLTELGVTRARVGWDFPLENADHLRAAGIEVVVDREHMEGRRRVKTPAQLAGIRRAQRAADAAMGVAERLIHACEPGLTVEAVRAVMQAACPEFGATLADETIVAVNAQAATGHDIGSGPIRPGDCVIVDQTPRDVASRCFTDMTRTFIAGGAAPGDELAEYWALSKEALDRVVAAVRPGVDGRELYAISADIFERAGKPTARTAPKGVALVEGYFHALGHGVGLDIHEAPSMGLEGQPLVAGDVIAVEPGCYRQGFGGVRLEDLLLVTEDGCEVLTQFPYEL